MTYIEINEDLRSAVVAFRGDIIVSRGQLHEIKNLNGYVFIDGQRIMACILYKITGQECEIVSLDSRVQGQGIGSKLIQLVIDKGKSLNCSRVWLITSNDNMKAIRFYQKRGFDMVCIHKNAITEARNLKPSIPLYGFDGIPIKHEIEFEYIVN
jgi:ribosomal protein S18 acetylase RimI-like enzyme